MTRRLYVLLFVAALWPALAAAQQPNTFARSNTLDLALDVSGVHDSDKGDVRGAQNGLLSDGYSSTLVGTASYARVARRLRLDGTVVSALRYYRAADRVRPTSHVGGLTAVVPFGRQSSVAVTQTAAYSPAYLYQLFPTAAVANVPIAAAPDYRVDTFSSMARSTNLSTSFASPIGSVALSADRSETDFWGQTTASDMSSTTGRAGMSWKFGRRWGLTTNYEQRVGEFGASGDWLDRRMQLSVDYSRPLSTTRRATFTFTLAPSMFAPPPNTVPASSTTAAPPADKRYRIEAATQMTVGIAPGWTVRGGYRRGADYVGTLNEPLFTDRTNLAIAGTLFTRFQVSTSGAWAQGRSVRASNSQTRALQTYTGTVRLNAPIGGLVSAYGEYLYYFYDFRDQAALAAALPTSLERRTFRFGVSVTARPIGRRR